MSIITFVLCFFVGGASCVLRIIGNVRLRCASRTNGPKNDRANGLSRLLLQGRCEQINIFMQRNCHILYISPLK